MKWCFQMTTLNWIWRWCWWILSWFEMLSQRTRTKSLLFACRHFGILNIHSCTRWWRTKTLLIFDKVRESISAELRIPEEIGKFEFRIKRSATSWNREVFIDFLIITINKFCEIEIKFMKSNILCINLLYLSLNIFRIVKINVKVTQSASECFSQWISQKYRKLAHEFNGLRFGC